MPALQGGAPMEYVFGIVIAAAVIVAWIVSNGTTTATIYQYQKGLLYRSGVFKTLLEPGRYRYWKSRTFVRVVDMRRNLVTLPGQEILTKDKINVKTSIVVAYEIADPAQVEHASTNLLAELYAAAQIVLRDLVSTVILDELLEHKGEIDAKLLTAVAAKAATLGLSVSAAAVKDVMLPPNLKRAYSGILEAQKDAQRQLEKARGEQAVLRSLANSAALYESNPNLLRARVIQALSTGNNSIVVGSSDILLAKEKPSEA